MLSEASEVLSELNIYKTTGIGAVGTGVVSYVHTATGLLIGLFVLGFVAVRFLRETLKLRKDLKGVDDRKKPRKK